jgi:hypothetical protein
MNRKEARKSGKMGTTALKWDRLARQLPAIVDWQATRVEINANWIVRKDFGCGCADGDVLC